MTITYDPDAAYFGVDSFDYRITNPDAAFDTATVTVTVNDTQAPVAVVTAPTAAQEFPLGTTSTVISGTATDNDSVASVEVRINGGAYSTAAGTGSWSYTATGLQNGQTYTADVRAYDPAGNISSVVSRTFSVAADANDPTVTISAPSAELPANTTATTVSGTAADDVSVALVQVRVNSGSWVSATGTTSWTYELSGLTNGSSTLVEARSQDGAGNFSTIASRTVTVNNPPTANADAISTAMNVSIVVDVLANDTNVDAGAVLTIESQPANGTATVN